MALIFSRIAHNYIKNGYYPTDLRTLGGVCSALAPAGDAVRMYDPCCGEGSALHTVQQHMFSEGADVTSLGVEFDAERAWHAKTVLTTVIHADANDVVTSPRSIGLLFLNPPYGFGVSDKANLAGNDRAERLERTFLHQSVPTLAYGGVMVLIVPYYVVDADMATYLGRHFRSLRAFMAPEQEFKQCVIFGVRDRPRTPPQAVLQMFEDLQSGKWVNAPDHELPEAWPGERYQVPDVLAEPDHKFHCVRLDPEQLGAEISRLNKASLWPQFDIHFAQTDREARRPLREMTQWHLALALAAGQVTGTVRSPGGRVLLIKGNTIKNKRKSVERVQDDDGGIKETVTLTDYFVPVIRAIEFTPGPTLGAIVTIR